MSPLAQRRASRFAPACSGTPRFRTPWAETRAGIALLLRRLAWHAGLDRAIEVEDGQVGARPTERKPATRVTFVEIRRGAAVFAHVTSPVVPAVPGSRHDRADPRARVGDGPRPRRRAGRGRRRARWQPRNGEPPPDSDIDLGVCYRGNLDVARLRVLAGQTADAVLGSAEPGGWGPWVNGGAWLVVDNVRVDWIYRDLDRVQQIWTDCRTGRYEIGVQAGHPLGFYSHTYAAEVALCRILADPSGELARLQGETRRYPDALAEALVAAAWEPELMLYSASSHGAKAVDTFFAAGCLFRAIGVLAHALHGHHHSWVIHEKRLVDSAGALTGAPLDFAPRAHGILGHIGTTAAEITAAVAATRTLLDDTLPRLPGRPPGLPL